MNRELMICATKRRKKFEAIDCPYQMILLTDDGGKRHRLYDMHQHTCGFPFDDKAKMKLRTFRMCMLLIK